MQTFQQVIFLEFEERYFKMTQRQVYYFKQVSAEQWIAISKKTFPSKKKENSGVQLPPTGTFLYNVSYGNTRTICDACP